VSVQDARFCHPTFRLNRRGNGSPTICRLRPVEGSNVVGQDQDISGWEAPGRVRRLWGEQTGRAWPCLWFCLSRSVTVANSAQATLSACKIFLALLPDDAKLELKAPMLGSDDPARQLGVRMCPVPSSRLQRETPCPARTSLVAPSFAPRPTGRETTPRPILVDGPAPG
jgi:hypothetical protein